MNVSQVQCEYTKVNSIPACVHSMDSTEANNEVQIPFKVSSFRSSNWRWFTLTIISWVTIGIFFNYDMPNALSDLIREKITHEVDSDNQVKYNQLYSAYSYPNIIMPIIWGVIVDKVGLYVGLII